MAPASRSYQLSATPFAICAQLLDIAMATLVLVLFLHFQGGFAFNSDNKRKIFNVCSISICCWTIISFILAEPFFFFFLYIQLHPFLMVIGLILIGGEGKESCFIMQRKKGVGKGELFSKAFSCVFIFNNLFFFFFSLKNCGYLYSSLNFLFSWSDFQPTQLGQPSLLCVWYLSHISNSMSKNFTN